MPDTEYIAGNVGDLDNYVNNVQANLGELMKRIPPGHMGSGPLTAANVLPPARAIRQEEDSYPVFPGVREMSEEVEELEEEMEVVERKSLDTSKVSPRMARVFNSIKGVISMISAVEEVDKKLYLEVSEKAFAMIDEAMRDTSAEIALLIYNKMRKGAIKGAKPKKVKAS
jgi:hypothetical protein